MSAELRESSIRNLLGYLDFLKPLLLQDNALVVYALRQYERLQARIRPPDAPLCLESFELSLANARIFFPSTEASVERILQLLSFSRPQVGQMVYLLDVLTVLVIIFRGSLKEKARFLFDWYNVSQTGIMTEVEHAVCIRRTSECFYKIKAIGVIDVTEEDAKHIALEARVRKTASGGQMKFIPGLTYEDFYQWTRDSAESAVLVKFVRVLDRLVDTLVAILNRVDAVGRIIAEKKAYKLMSLHVPKMDMFPGARDHSSALHIMYRSQTTVTICMSTVGIDCRQSAEAFIECEKRMSVPNPLYAIPEVIQKRTSKATTTPVLEAQGQSNVPPPNCCSREYVLRSRQRFALNKYIIQCGGPFLRVDISHLDPDSTYVLTVYTPTWKFPPIGATTLRPSGADIADETSAVMSLAILPASLSLADGEMLIASTPTLERSMALVFPGTICPIDTILRSCILYADSDVLGNNYQKFASTVAASSSALYSKSWPDCVNRLIGMCSAAAAAARVGGLTPSHSAKQVFYHNGMGPWSNPQLRDHMQSILGKHLFEPVLNELERVYARYTATISPPRYYWSNKCATLVFVKDPNVDDETADLKAIKITALSSTIRAALQNPRHENNAQDAAGSEEAPFTRSTCEKDVIIILRSPLDLMLPLGLWTPSDKTKPEVLDDPVAAKVSSRAVAVAPLIQTREVSQDLPPTIRLTGKHELIHGEYSKSTTTVSLTSEEVAQIITPDFDVGVSLQQKQQHQKDPLSLEKARQHVMEGYFDVHFHDCVASLLDWASFCNQKKSRQRESAIMLVSTGWNNGVNFEILHKETGSRIEHICLLPTRVKSDERGREETQASIDRTDALLARIKFSLPNGCIMSVLNASPLRSLVVKSSLRSAHIEFIPINKIYDKTIQPVGSESVNLSRLRVLDGPRISRISFDDVHVVLSAIGYGRVQCTLFELPFEINQLDAVALLSAERDKLRLIASSWQRCTKQRHMLFHFKGLLPYCNYCISVEPEDNGLPIVAQFRTLYDSACPMTSIILAAVSEADYSMPAVGIGKIAHLLSGLRPPAAPVHLMHHFSRRKRYMLGLDKPHKADLQLLYRRVNVIHTLAKPDGNEISHDITSTHSNYDAKFSPIQISVNGKFCRIAPRDGSARCLQAMIDAVDKISILMPQLENMVLIVQRPLIRFLQKQPSGEWRQENLAADYLNICSRLIERALRWKAAVPARDCQILCFAEVSCIQVATIGFRQPSSCYNDIASLGYLDKESLTEVPLDLMSSSVAYSDRDDESLESCSTENNANTEFINEASPDDLEIGLKLEEQEGANVANQDDDEEGDIEIGLSETAEAREVAANDHANVQVDSQPAEGFFEGASEKSKELSQSALMENIPLSKPTSAQSSLASQEVLLSLRGDSIAHPAPLEKILHADGWVEPMKEKILHDDDWQETKSEPSQSPREALREPSLLESEIGLQSTSDIEAPSLDVNIRHIILPVWEHARPQDKQSMVAFPDGINILGDKLEYFLNRDVSDFANVNIKMLSQNRTLYGAGINNSSTPETAVYLFDFFIRPGEGNMISNGQEPFISGPDESVLGSQVDLNISKVQESIEIASRNRKPYQYHHILSRNFLHNVDFFEVLMGPIIGNVSSTSARVLFETNLDLDELEIVARPLRRVGAQPNEILVGDDEEVSEDAVLLLTSVKAYKMVSCLFERLLPGRIYEIVLPQFYGVKALGSFRTPKNFTRYVEVIFAGQDGLQNIPMIRSLLAHFYSQQMIDCKLLLREQRTLFSAKIASLLSGYAPPSVPGNNMWALVAEHLQTPLTESHMVIHLGSQSFLTAFLKDLINVLLEHGRRLFLPLRDACATEAYYFNQFEEVIRDTFRLVWSIPVLKEALASGSHMPLFIPEYLVSTRTIPAEELSNEGDKKLVAVIRKVYETHFTSYICSLYDWDPAVSHHGRVWRSGPLAVIMLDLVTGRKKLKRKAGQEGTTEADDAAKDKLEKKKSESFSLGFLDKAQWVLIKNVADDEFITQVVICSQLPFLSLHEIPFESIAPKEVLKGEMIEWSPTNGDLEQFLMYWIDWLQPKPKRAVVSKNFALVSSNFIPYVTTVQDLMTGSKIQQVCVGAFNADPFKAQEQPEVNISADFELVGKIGRLRYIHKFGEQDDVMLDSSRDGSGGGKLDPNMDVSHLLRPNYGVLKFCFDSWKAVGHWRIFNESEMEMKSEPDSPRLLIGPILGPPEVFEQNTDDRRQCFRVGVMIEVDCSTAVTFAVQDAFTNEVRHYTFDCIPFRPIMCSIGPLDTACRYNVKIVGGIRASHCVPFVLSTHMDLCESNFVFINAQIPDSTIPNEDFSKELLQRLKVPFNGITVAVHMNSHPDFTNEIEELRRLPFLATSLAQCQKLGHLTVNVFHFLRQMMESIRGMYRRHFARPAYRELLRSSFTLFMQTYPIFPPLHHVDSEGDVMDENDVTESESESILRFIKLMFTRVEQEYFEQVNRPGANVLRALFKREVIVQEQGIAEDLSEEEMNKILELEKLKELMVEELSIQDDISADEAVKQEKFNPEAHPVKVVFKQWLRDMLPMPVEWFDWHSPNRKAIIELIPSIELSNLIAMFRKFENSPIDVGVRIVVIDGKRDGSGVDACYVGDGRSGLKLFNQALKFKGGGKNGDAVRIDRDLCFVCPSSKYGTMRKPLQVNDENEERILASIFTVDSIFRCNAAERALKMTEAEKVAQAEAKQKEKETGKAKTKKVQAARAEEERLRILQGQQAMNEILAQLVPDGYLFVEARTFAWSTQVGKNVLTDTMSTVNARIVNSLRMDVTSLDPTAAAAAVTAAGYDAADEDNSPSLVDYVQIPKWLQKFFPSREGVFVQDDILLIMRQEPETRDILRQLEGDEIVALGVEIYERSRLSELSRPTDLREVDMDAPGVVSLFLKDLVDRYWDEVVPENVKPFLVPLYDDFLRSFVLSRALPDPKTQLAAADAFARGMQHALVLSVSLKISMDLALSDPQRYEAIMNMPSEAEDAIQALLRKDKAKKDAHDRAQFRDTNAYNADEVEQQVREMEELNAGKNENDSDLEELEEEERQFELNELRKEAEEEAAERLEELREQEEEEAEAAREAAGLLEDEEEDEEEEEEEEPEIFDEELAAVAAQEQAAKEKEDKKMKRPEVVKKKTKAELLAEKQAGDEVTIFEGMKEASETILELGFCDLVETIALEHIFEADLDELMAARPPVTDEVRIFDAVLSMTRLAKEQTTQKRALGKRLIFLS